MTDWKAYADRLAEKFSYRNTYYYQQPRLDISAVEVPAHFLSNDFVISSEVFEHVVPPVSRAFENVSKMLKPGGLLFSLCLTRTTKTRSNTSRNFMISRSWRITKPLF